MKAVVTGGAGFIGSHLVDLLLSNGFSVVVIDNLSTGRLSNLQHCIQRIDFVEADLTVENSQWTSHISDADYVFHLASLADIVPSIERPSDYFYANVVSTLNVLKNCVPNKLTKLIYAASSSCYGITDIFPTPETAPICPEYPYALTKRLGEELVLHWTKVYQLQAISTRFFNVYGTRSRTSGTYGAVFGVFLAQKLANAPLTIVGDGTQVRDFTYVTDVCRGIYLAAMSEFVGEIFNIGSGTPQSINHLAQLIGGDIVNIPKRPGEPDITHADISKAEALLNYKPTISFEHGVQLVLDQIDYWKDAPVWTPQSIDRATATWFEKLN